MNIQLGKEARNNFEKDFFKLINNAVFEKIVKNVGKCRNIKILKTKKKKKLFSIRTKLSHYKVFDKIIINNGNEENSNTYS